MESSRKLLWSGRIVSALASIPFIYGSIFGPLSKVDNTIALEMQHMQMPSNTTILLTCLMVPCLVLYWLPKTLLLGSVLFTGYMGGAIVAHMRVGDPVIFQIIVTLLLWLGSYLREPRIRSVLPIIK